MSTPFSYKGHENKQVLGFLNLKKKSNTKETKQFGKNRGKIQQAHKQKHFHIFAVNYETKFRK